MGVKTIYKCDKCGAEQETPDQFWTIGVSVQDYRYRSTCVSPIKSMQVCRTCLESLGIHAKTRDPVEIAKQPTLEELIIEVVRQAAAQGDICGHD